LKIERFEDILAWQEVRKLVNMVYEVVKNNPIFQKDFRLCSQITGGAVSVMSNIAEGFSRKTRKEFINFLFIAKASAGEVQSLLYVCLDQYYISKEKFNELYNQADKTARLISGFISYLINKSKTTQKTQSTQRTQGTQSTPYD